MEVPAISLTTIEADWWLQFDFQSCFTEDALKVLSNSATSSFHQGNSSLGIGVKDILLRSLQKSEIFEPVVKPEAHKILEGLSVDSDSIQKYLLAEMIGAARY